MSMHIAYPHYANLAVYKTYTKNEQNVVNFILHSPSVTVYYACIFFLYYIVKEMCVFVCVLLMYVCSHVCIYIYMFVGERGGGASAERAEGM